MPEETRDPMRAAQANMRPPALRRFYKRVEVVAVDGGGGGFALRLDGRGARTPGKRPLVAPTRAVAELIAAEWAGQGETIEPMSMPATRLANSAIDGVADALDATRAAIAAYADADLVCYRAEAPAALVALQAEAFDPALAWARDRLGARFVTTVGLAHVAQPEAALAAARAAVEAYAEPFAVAALHVMTSLTGSLLLALMTAEGALSRGSRLARRPCRRGLPDRPLGRGRRGEAPPRRALARFRGGGEGPGGDVERQRLRSGARTPDFSLGRQKKLCRRRNRLKERCCRRKQGRVSVPSALQSKRREQLKLASLRVSSHS